jgi:tRNA(Ile)-lysidine synthase
MTRLEKKLRASLRRSGIDTGAGSVVAVSGGADSTALLDALVRIHHCEGLAGGLVVAHLNHQLRGEESDDDEKFVREMAVRLKLDCAIERIDVAGLARARKENLEASARRIRYDFLRRVAESRNLAIVFTAHTQDDQVETILMRLIRGTGPEGLRSIHQNRQLAEKVLLIRPLLDATRDEVIEHCRHYDLAFRTDSTNTSPGLTRNRVRHELLPLLRTFNQRFNETIARTAELALDDQNYLTQLASEVYAVIPRDREIEIALLHSIHPVIRRRILRMWLRDLRGGLERIEMAHLNALEDLIEKSQSGSIVDLPSGWIARREFNRITLDQRKEILPLDSLSLLRGQSVNFGKFRFSIQRKITCQKSRQNEKSGHYFALLRECEELDGLIIRTRLPGDAYLPSGGSHRTKLKTLMIKKKIPISERGDYPVLVTSDGSIVWSPGLPVASQFAPELTAMNAMNDADTSSCAMVTAEKLGQFTVSFREVRRIDLGQT